MARIPNSPVSLPALAGIPTAGMLSPLRDNDAYQGDDENLMRAIVGELVGKLPCFEGMRVAGDTDPVGVILFGSGGPDSSPLADCVRAAGVPLRHEAFPFLSAMGGAGPAPSISVLLESLHTVLLMEERHPSGKGNTFVLYAWDGGKAHYKAVPDDLLTLKSMVDVEAVRLRAAASVPVAAAIKVAHVVEAPAPAPPDSLSLRTEEALRAVREVAEIAEIAERSMPRKPVGPLVQLREAGFVPVGTQDVGSAMEVVRGSTRWLVCRGGGAPSLARSETFVLREYADDCMLRQQDGLSVRQIIEAIAAPSNIPSP